MNIYTTISLCIAIAGFIGGVIAALVKLGASVGRLMERLESNEKRDKEERDKIGAFLCPATPQPAKKMTIRAGAQKA